MAIFRVDPRPSRAQYGTSLGILLMRSRVPCIPGSVANASSFPFPVICRVVEDLDVRRLVHEGDLSLVGPVIREARALEGMGAAAITADCGYMALFQQQVAAAVNVPVCLSSLLQLPFIHRLLPASRKVGVIVADSRSLRPQILDQIGVAAASPTVFAGLQDCPAFRGAIMEERGDLDSEAIEAEVVAASERMLAAHPEIGAILLECSELPPYAAAVQAATRLPVFDYMTMLNHVFGALAQRAYAGTMY